jgi:small GTP-binding protein
MITPQYEIKVALLGYVSVGKTTVLNALLREKFSEVSMRRTTAGINFFRIVSHGSNVTGTEQQQQQWLALPDEEAQTAESVLREIEASNQVLREANRVEEKVFTIELDKDLCQMREDTSLVIVDIPGINEANRKTIFKDYAKDKWDTFDCVIVVMDARQGVNTSEQVELLEFVKQNLHERKNLPVIILGNKVDDPDSEELGVLVRELSEEISKVFEVGDMERSLEAVLQASKESRRSSDHSKLPVFIPTSASHAFFYRTASLMSFENFNKFDRDLIDQIGREEIGRFKWKKMTEPEQYKEVFKAVSEREKYEERLAATNFDKFLAVLTYFVGGTDVQLELLKKQIDTALKNLEWGPDLFPKLRSIYDSSIAFKQDVAPMKKAFWNIYEKCKESALNDFATSLNIEKLQEPLDALTRYSSMVGSWGLQDEKARISKQAKILVHRQLGIVVTKHNDFDVNEWEKSVHNGNSHVFTCPYCNRTPDGTVVAPIRLTWKALSPYDWRTIFESLLLLSFNRHFCENFGQEKILLELLKFEQMKKTCALSQQDLDCYEYERCSCPFCSNGSSRNRMYQRCTHCKRDAHFKTKALSGCYRAAVKMKLGKGKLSPVDKPEYSFMFQIDTPESLADPKHFGHVAWKCCKLIASLETSA